MRTVKFYHAGCPVCVNAEQELVNIIDNQLVSVEIIHLGESKNRLSEAENAGVKSVPALVLENGNVLHINFGASLSDLKN